MKVYLVGGAVRDQLLNYPIKERDWVVVGGTPAALLQQGYRQVGRDFPVFLHPKTGEEYSLARTERKLGRGYYGFTCDFNPNITLEEDLARRDLTINAMAFDAEGGLIDPYQGAQDIRNKCLRHVSPAFCEDPVRVLRVARFAARYAHLGFKLAAETRALMYEMVQRGELAHLVAERVWQEWERSLQEKNPELFIITLRSCGALQVVFPEFDALFGIPHAAQQFPIIDSGTNSLKMLSTVSALTNDAIVRFAAFVRDVGKGNCPIHHWPISTCSKNQSKTTIAALCQRLRIPIAYRQSALMVAKHSLTLLQLNDLDAAHIVSVFEQTDAFRRPELFSKLLLVNQADHHMRGITPSDKMARQWQALLQACKKVNMQPLLARGYSGEEMKLQLNQQRINLVLEKLKTMNQ